MATISFNLVSPERLLFNGDVGMIIVSGRDGDIGVLPGHSKLLSSLRPGRVMIFGEEKNLLKSFFVAGGFVEINPEKCIVLAEGVNEMKDLDKDTIQQQIQKLQSGSGEVATSELAIAQSKVAALESTYYEKL